MKKIFSFIIFFLVGFHSSAQLNKIGNSFNSKMNSSQYEGMIKQLVDLYPYASIPFFKEYMILKPGSWSPSLKSSFERLIEKVGTHNFENLSEEILFPFVLVPSVSFILGKKKFKSGDFPRALAHFNRVPKGHYLEAFANHSKGAIYALEGNTIQSEDSFNRCLSSSRNTSQNKDYCQAGKARSLYAQKRYDEAEKSYSRIKKKSSVWPTILFEEAWTSFYQKKYNKTLGKLVSYKAPVFDFIFNPEIEILKAMSFMKMCFYDDVQKTVEDFYKRYGNAAQQLNGYIQKRRNSLSNFYNLMINFEANRSTKNELTSKILNSIRKEQAYQEIKNSLLSTLREQKKLLNDQGTLKNRLALNLNEVLESQRSLLGLYVAKRLIEHKNNILQGLEDMSYIRLEVLAQLKERIYQDKSDSGKRGDIKYLKRKPSQYFWNFNGEFWADELGDYVFALPSRCDQS